MLPDQLLLRIPGPSPIPPSVQRAMSQPMIGHRGAETTALLQRIKPRLKPVFGTEQDVLLVTGSGTAGLEAAVANTAKPGDEVLVVVVGAFGDRFVKIAKAYQLHIHQIDVTWGEAANPEDIKAVLQKYPEISSVFVTYCETSTGVLNPVKEIAEAIHEVSDALVIVDGVSCVAGVETEFDAWGIDILVTGTQKAFMLPGGMFFAVVSERAWQVIEANTQPRFYLDLTKYRDGIAKDSTPFTPALSILFGLEQVLTLLEEEGLEQVYARHRLMRDMTRAAFRALEVPLLVEDTYASPTVTAIKPADFDAEQLRKQVKQEFNLAFAGGQQHMKGEIFRIGHMGYCSPADVLQVISAVEIGLMQIGKQITLGAGTQAAQQIYLEQGANK
ncbi:alanine--glyoxylate aminotransferase family protein [Terribacillus sp. DMT04]|uniref:pyridoxal-phosphate-dependent aminotransferase family protein n=1 Tax=Terribacillus sp. DMT04 TaxID=2850441 RepID=UPI001C2C85B3|nr:alanine--glyoxylate aminotransferase family protein [Terribacillus sp. DMT04]QXE01690.1 alanine--glyoxylate aminotransferase family protein [Terribacillus sp. DMT04]